VLLTGGAWAEWDRWGGRLIDALGHLGALVQQLGAGDAQVQPVGAGVVGLVVELDRPKGNRVEAGRSGVLVAQAVRATASSNTLTTWVPSDPANSAVPPTAVSPAMRPCLWAVVPRGR
jgi:hypothetical protein